MSTEAFEIPVLPLRDVVIFPHMVIPLFVGRERSVNALDVAMSTDKKILLVAQKKAEEDAPSAEDIYKVGTISSVMQLIKLPDNTTKVLVEGGERAKIVSYMEGESYLSAKGFVIETDSGGDEKKQKQTDVLARSLLSRFSQYAKLRKRGLVDVLNSMSGVDSPERLGDMIATHLMVKIEEKQKVLETPKVFDRLRFLLGLVESEIDVMQIEQRIRGRVKKQMEKSQREYYLSEQMKAIQKELGGASDVFDEGAEYKKKIEKVGMPPAVKEKALLELTRLGMMSALSAEATVVRNYLDWLVGVPWKSRTKLKISLEKAEKILNDDHFGLEKVKERILEYLAVQTRIKKVKGSILCLVGPPGVGKTSLGRSIARATSRKFVRMTLGGVRDEAEIRGHRRTYIGALPGKLVQNLAKVGVNNPLFLLDELDKMSMDFRGDPASALLEVLDPEQNHTFQDHYLEVDFDLSNVMFVCTANSLNIPIPLLDRMEVIRLSGYTEEEKMNIASSFLVPKQIKDHGLKKGELEFTSPALRDIIRYYTREAGVRGLEREISKISRKVVRKILSDPKTDSVRLRRASLSEFLGVRRFRFGLADSENRVGQVTGLAWTETGGDLLTVEVAVIPGKGKLIQTGQLGSVMQESVKAALTVVRSRAEGIGIAVDFQDKTDVHVHVPEGAIPKDGPSAGITVCTALVSALTNIPANAGVAMTGEITLRGEVLPIGGLKEKLLAALRGGIKTVLIPSENNKDLKDIPNQILRKLNVISVRWFEEVLDIALLRNPVVVAPEKEVPEEQLEVETEGETTSGSKVPSRH